MRSDTPLTNAGDVQVPQWERLNAVESIKQVKARYFRHLDAKNWEEFRQVFTSDARIGPIERGFAPDDKPGDVLSVDQFLDLVPRSLAGVTSVHHGHMPEIELISPTEARVTWAMEDLLIFPPGSKLRRLRGYGHYRETYVRGDDGWRIASMRLDRLHVDREPE
jgi:SnoaL-like domain